MDQCKNLQFMFLLRHFIYILNILYFFKIYLFFRFTFTNEKDDTKIVKKMTGSMRVGALSKGLLLVNEKEVDLVIICSVPPTVVLLNSIVSILPEKLKVNN